MSGPITGTDGEQLSHLTQVEHCPAPDTQLSQLGQLPSPVAMPGLASAGKSVRDIAVELGVSKSTAHRRTQSAGLPMSNVVARALLLAKVGDLEKAYARSGAGDDRAAAALADLDRIRGILREGMAK